MSESKISVVIITFNEAAFIERCIKSVVAIADEIIVLDSFSTDATVTLAKQAGAKVSQQHFRGYGLQKNDANALASHTWILSLDADEELSPELCAEIANWKQTMPTKDAYSMPRLNNYLGKWLRYGGWYPDAKLRLFRKDKGAWVAQSVHEYWKPNAEIATGNFSKPILHYTIQSLAQHLRKIEQYSELSAIAAVANGKTISIWKAFFGPIWLFFHRFIIRGGFLDGKIGYLACRMVCFEKWLKYQKIRLYHAQKVGEAEI